ncbi:uncharacterized protein FA14DRAFT_183974 [Meira miltonrushii]|uniref:Uncharacterized protein n=1 Tax=Meira miltonrushii TaxID=1280837 RepID=A0A316VNH5_9BASI|nr:uncharacterized protein FA14DRAFT_183974 [Meira miltonrushii]PWN38618.1 hypothetical protein FA14DRAFT_183974 [Meira miltonrushii]
MDIIKKVHAAIIKSLKSKYVADFLEIVSDYLQTYRKEKENSILNYRFDPESNVTSINYLYQKHAKVIIVKVFKKYQSTVREAFDQQLATLEDTNSEATIKLVIKSLLIHVENECRSVRIDPFSLSDEVFQAYMTETEGESGQPRQITVKMEKKWTFFDMQTMQRDVSKQFKEDPEKFKLGFCKIITCVFKIVCWTFQGDKDLNEQIRQNFSLSQPPMGLNYDIGYCRETQSSYRPKEPRRQKPFYGKAGKSNKGSTSKTPDTRTKEEKEWDAEQRRQAPLKRYETRLAELLGEGTEAKLYVSQFCSSINVYLSKEKRIQFTPSREWYVDSGIKAEDTIQLRLKLGEELYYIYDPDEHNDDDEHYGVGGELIIRKRNKDGSWSEYPYFFTTKQESSAEVIMEIIKEQKVQRDSETVNG